MLSPLPRFIFLLSERNIRFNQNQLEILETKFIIIIIYLNCKWGLPGGSGTTIRHNKQITHITQNNTPHSNKTQHTKLHKQ
jgi:hypothetical protein